MKEKFNLQIAKFSAYGFLKNLKFFEPYLIYYFLMSNLSLFQIGLLFSIREIMIYVFELPSGVFADVHGKKLELTICFIMYIISFVFFFIGGSYFIFIIAIVFYGLGEALRSGTHKAMIMTYLDRNEITDSKTKVYGKTRSWSLIGSTVSALFSIYLVIALPNLSFLFLIAIIPYILDLLLILTYPSYLNEKQKDECEQLNFIQCNINHIKYTFRSKEVRNVLFNSSLYASVFKTLKDYIQPILLAATITIVALNNFNDDEKTKIILGIIYAIIYFISSFASRNAHKVSKKIGSNMTITISWLLLGVSITLVGIFVKEFWIISALFLIIYIIFNIRKPIIVQKIGDKTHNTKRATVLSVDSQMTSIFTAILAPLIGYLADHITIGTTFTIIGVILIIISSGFVIQTKTN